MREDTTNNGAYQRQCCRFVWLGGGREKGEAHKKRFKGETQWSICSVSQVAPYASEASVFFHEKEGYADSAGVLNLTITCPVNAEIRSHNVSLEILKSTGGGDTSPHLGTQKGPRDGGTGPYLTYKELWYDCISCETDTYSLAGGYFEYTVYPVYNSTDTGLSNDVRESEYVYQQKLIFQQIKCHECSFGGHCADGNIYPKAQHWGIALDGAVSFYNCPDSYCCAKPVCWDGYDSCAENRVGTLCGRCGANYSEAMFSSACLPNPQCHATWVFPVTISLAFVYALFLLFQNDLKNFLVGQPQPQPKPVVRAYSVKAINKKKRAYQNDIQLEEDKLPQKEENDNTIKLRATNNRIISTISTKNLKPEINESLPPLVAKRNLVENEKPVADHTTDASEETEESLEMKQAEGGIFLIILFYYFQDSSIVYIRATYANVESEIMRTLQDVADSLFKFRIDLSVFVSNVCIMPNVTPVEKIMAKLSFNPALFAILVTTATIGQLLKRHQSKSLQKFGSTLSVKTASGMVFGMLFSYQTIASSMFQLINCVAVNGTNVLFIDGHIQCHEGWQVVTLIAIALCLVPFSFYIMLAPAHLVQGRIHIVTFFIACFCAPIVHTFLYIFHQVFQRGKRPRETTTTTTKTSSSCPEARAVYIILQGPYREYSIKFCGLEIFLCWSGMLLARRLMLVLCDTFVYDLLLRVSQGFPI